MVASSAASVAASRPGAAGDGGELFPARRRLRLLPQLGVHARQRPQHRGHHAGVGGRAALLRLRLRQLVLHLGGVGVVLLAHHLAQRQARGDAGPVLDGAAQRPLGVLPLARRLKQLPHLAQQPGVRDVHLERHAQRLLRLRGARPVQQRHQAQVPPHLGVGVVQDVGLRQRRLRPLQVPGAQHGHAGAQPGGRARAHAARRHEHASCVGVLARHQQRGAQVEVQLQAPRRRAAAQRHGVRVRLLRLRHPPLRGVQVAQ
mmetsp:Transcript_38668/g.95931  ORF Transcript_38668/g.95931 Transcript_38668/m.95931 type:complete len:259 (+) Transcript_38668:113-889(+)